MAVFFYCLTFLIVGLFIGFSTGYTFANYEHTRKHLEAANTIIKKLYENPQAYDHLANISFPENIEN